MLLNTRRNNGQLLQKPCSMTLFPQRNGSTGTRVTGSKRHAAEDSTKAELEQHQGNTSFTDRCGSNSCKPNGPGHQVKLQGTRHQQRNNKHKSTATFLRGRKKIKKESGTPVAPSRCYFPWFGPTWPATPPCQEVAESKHFVIFFIRAKKKNRRKRLECSTRGGIKFVNV